MKINPKLKQIICIWVALFPTSIAVNFVLKDVLINQHFIIKILISTVIIVPLMVLFFIPMVTKIISRWLK